MTYTGRLEDDGVDVVCSAVQTDLYSGSISTRMGVSAAAVPGPAIPVGGIIGIVLGVLFLLFLCAALLLLFLCWDKIQYKRKVRGFLFVTEGSQPFGKPAKLPLPQC